MLDRAGAGVISRQRCPASVRLVETVTGAKPRKTSRLGVFCAAAPSADRVMEAAIAMVADSAKAMVAVSLKMRMIRLALVCDGSREINAPSVVVIVCRSFGWP